MFSRIRRSFIVESNGHGNSHIHEHSLQAAVGKLCFWDVAVIEIQGLKDRFQKLKERNKKLKNVF